MGRFSGKYLSRTENLLEVTAQGLRRLRHSWFGNLPWPLYRLGRKLALSFLYFLSLGKGRWIKVAGIYPLQVEWERLAIDFSTWEAEFIQSFAKALKPGEVVFNIGANVGEWSALAASLVGSENVHVFEPNLQSWKDIEKIFELNSFLPPAGIFPGFVANIDSFPSEVLAKATMRRWPPKLRGDSFFETLKNPKNIPIIKLDTYCERLNVIPSIILMDVEGAEGEILRGARNVLEEFHPLLFVSLHPLALEDVRDSKAGLISWIEERGYRALLLAIKHEEHWQFTPMR